MSSSFAPPTTAASHSSLAVERVRTASLRPAGSPPPADVVALNMGEPDFDTPAPITEAAIDALREGHTHYVDLNGDPELRELIAVQSSAIAGYPIGAEDVLVSHGGAAAITASILALVNPGDKVLLPEPTYSLYLDAIELAGGSVVYVSNRDDHHLDLDMIAEHASDATMIILCNPVNPTGAVFGKEELAALTEVLDEKTLVLVDEAYANLIYDDKNFAPALAVPELRGRLVYIQTLSKTYAMTGWRVGYVVAPTPIAADIRLVHRTMNGSVNAAVQRAALTALRSGAELTSPMLTEYRARRDYVVERVAAIAGAHMVVPDGAFYAFVKYPGTALSSDVARLLLEGGLSVRAGAEYGPSGEGHVRLSFAADIPTLKEGLDRLERVFAQL
ncbi:pyridoxal phosphate-dependent aminotransferase [Rhodococcus sp. NPDC056743]|uniref:pyridoxal phosphate-dependent aminotransferase n=1 Tax=Rhodococcus sp. NPDC056743 TaxID=3345934 RepID=UPI00366BC9C7